MFTPQQLEQITFHTSVFGGYDMDSVDEFLVALIEDYNTLYKDNATLQHDCSLKKVYYMSSKTTINKCTKFSASSPFHGPRSPL